MEIGQNLTETCRKPDGTGLNREGNRTENCRIPIRNRTETGRNSGEIRREKGRKLDGNRKETGRKPDGKRNKKRGVKGVEQGELT